MATVSVTDVAPVRSRVSMSAVIAGAAVSLAVYLLLSLLGVAIGLSVSAHATDEQLGLWAAAWAVIALLVALFCGGFIVSQCTAGETTGEAAVYGVVMWGVVVAFLLWLSTTGVRFGFNSVMSMANTPAIDTTNTASTPADADLEKAGFSKKVIEENKEFFKKLGESTGTQLRAEANVPQAKTAAWWTFAGVLFSMLAAMVGAVCGSGPQVVVAGFPVRSRFVLPGNRPVVVNK